MLPDEPLDAALTDAAPLSQLALRRARGQGCDEPSSVGLGEPVPDLPLTGTMGRAHAERRFTGLRLRVPQLLHRADQGVCEVPAVQVSPHKVQRRLHNPGQASPR